VDFFIVEVLRPPCEFRPYLVLALGGRVAAQIDISKSYTTVSLVGGFLAEAEEEPLANTCICKCSVKHENGGLWGQL
jgi:hypothetical protein